jgi:hypothetical protein
MLDQDFCEFLEYKISKAFEHSENDQVSGFWCDGVVSNQPNSYYSQKYVNDHRQVILKAFIGIDGQSEYELVLKFGNKALSRFTRSLDLKECVPDPHQQNWFEIDTLRKKIEIKLN